VLFTVTTPRAGGSKLAEIAALQVVDASGKPKRFSSSRITRR
jgi:hypothetical protein